MEQIIKAIINKRHEVEVSHASQIDIKKLSDKQYHVVHNGDSILVEVLRYSPRSKKISLSIDDVVYDIDFKDAVDVMVERMGLDDISGNEAADCIAPMPGLVLDILVQPDEAVEAGQPIVILEAMKMENVIKASIACTIDEIRVAAHETVEKGQILVTYK